jgi:ubiquinone/menaquinone biosynthesis C-methylase UbiE
VIREYLHKKRLNIVKKHLGGIADLDLGAGKSPKGEISLDIGKEFDPDIRGDVQFLPIRNESVSSVVCSHVIEHVNDVNKVMDEIRRILKKDGLAVFFLPDDGSKLWRVLKPAWTIYYGMAVSKESTPETHTHSFNYEKFEGFLKEFFDSLEVGKMNLGMEIYAVCKRR